MKSIFIQYGVLASQQTAIVYEWVFVDAYSSDPETWDLYYEADASNGNITGMINELTIEYPPEEYPGFYAVYYDTSNFTYYLFESLVA
jgi:hypothetical protein